MNCWHKKAAELPRRDIPAKPRDRLVAVSGHFECNGEYARRLRPPASNILFPAGRANMPLMQPRSLAIEEVPAPENGPHIFRLSGPLLLTTLTEFQTRVRADRSHNLILDFTDVPYIDSAGIGTLVGIYIRHQRDENGLSLVGVNDRVRTALKISHVDQFFRFFDSLCEAQAKRA
jgi:anti-sigma B factor antagonist